MEQNAKEIQELYKTLICWCTFATVYHLQVETTLIDFQRPGTGNSGSDSFSQGYVPLVGQGGLGFDACFLKENDNMLGDAALVAERYAYAANALSNISGKKVIAQGWSQGNLDVRLFALSVGIR